MAESKGLRFDEKKTQEYKQQKRKQWEEIQTKAPDLAKFMIDLSAVFGKFKRVDVEFNDD